MQQPKQPNNEFIRQSLVNQIADLSMDLANRDAIITELYQEMEQLNNELAEYRKEEIDEMDKEVNNG